MLEAEWPLPAASPFCCEAFFDAGPIGLTVRRDQPVVTPVLIQFGALLLEVVRPRKLPEKGWGGEGAIDLGCRFRNEDGWRAPCPVQRLQCSADGCNRPGQGLVCQLAGFDVRDEFMQGEAFEIR